PGPRRRALVPLPHRGGSSAADLAARARSGEPRGSQRSRRADARGIQERRRASVGRHQGRDSRDFWMRPPSARSLAAAVLVRVERGRAFAAAALDVELDRAVQLDARERALATELAYGALRVLPWLVSNRAPHEARHR